MTERLSQQAIDGLFAARRRDGGPALTLEPRLYNFRQPFRLGPAAQRLLDGVQTTFVQGLRRTLSMQLRMPVEVGIAATETVDRNDFLMSLGSPCVAYEFEAGPRGEAPAILDWGLNNAFAFVDRLLGGSGQTPALTRPLTPIEEGIVRLVTERTLPNLAAAWKEFLPIGTTIRGYETAPNPPVGGNGELRVLATLVRLRFEGHEGTMTLGLPWGALEPVLDDRSAGRRAPQGPLSSPQVTARRLAEGELRHSHLTLAARLPATLLSVGQLKALAVGQVIDTGHPTDSPVELFVNNRLLYLGKPGQARGRVVVSVEERAMRPAPRRSDYNRKGRIV